MEKYVQITRKESTKPTGTIGSPSYMMRATLGKGTAPELLDVNGCIGRLTRLLAGPVKEKIRLRTALGDSVLPVMADQEEMGSVFFALVECGRRVAPGGSMTVLTTLLPLHVRLVSERTGNGRALLSFHVAARGGERLSNLAGPGYDNALRALSNVRKIVEKHHGCFRMCLRAAQITFNIYLPVVPPLRLLSGTTNIGSRFPVIGEGL